jgi:hypothetical protein
MQLGSRRGTVLWRHSRTLAQARPLPLVLCRKGGVALPAFCGTNSSRLRGVGRARSVRDFGELLAALVPDAQYRIGERCRDANVV